MTFKLSDNLYLKDPQQTELGRQIIHKSIRLIGKLGFEEFTFKKLSTAIGSTEASVYRYFENKHKLLIYLVDWYWTSVEHRIDFEIHNIKSAPERLRICIRVLVEELTGDKSINSGDGASLHRIVTDEFEKTFLTKQVDADNRDGLFLPYKSLCKKIAAIVREINPKYDFPHSLVSTVMGAITHQLYYAQHLPSLTNMNQDMKKHRKKLIQFLDELVFHTIQ